MAYNLFIEEVLIEKLIFNLYSDNIKTSIGAIYYIKQKVTDGKLLPFFYPRTVEIIEGCICFLNKLPPRFNFEI